MAKGPIVNKKGEEIKEYPKLVKTEKGKVRVNSREEEDALEGKVEDKKAAGWQGKKSS